MFQSAQFNLESDQTQISLGNDFVISIYVDTAGQPTNTVFFFFFYPQDKVQFIDSSFTDSKYPNIIERKTENGLIKLTSFSSTPYNGNNGLFARLKFRALTNSEATITIENNSKIHANDGKGTDVSELSALPASITLFPAEKNQQPVVKKGETIIETNQTTLSLTPDASPMVFDFTEKGVADYSTFSGYPKLYPPGQKFAEANLISYKFLGLPLVFLNLALIFLFLIFLLIKLLKRKNEPK